MAKINYAVLALKAAESDALAMKLKTDGLEKMANWLQDNGAELYGETREDWKPFKNKTIREMLATGARVYESNTGLIDGLDDDLGNITDLYDASITVYFIDVFALYLDRYRLLANRLDFAVGKNAKCCLIVPYGLSKETQEIQDQLMLSFNRLWPTVCLSRELEEIGSTVLAGKRIFHIGSAR